MKNTNLWLSALAVVALTASAQAETTKAIPFKARIDAVDGSVDVVLRLYDQATARTPLFEEIRTAKVSDGTFFALADVPAAVLGSASRVWIEAATVSEPLVPLAPRQPFVLKRAAKEGVLPNSLIGVPLVSLCFTCGGDYPLLTSIIPLPYPSTPTERGGGCAEPMIAQSDSSPFLCSR